VDDGEKHWFVYARTPGRITAAPANWKGWLALTTGIVLTVASGMLVMWIARDMHPMLRFLTLGATIVTGVLLLVRLALSKGKAAS